jgi:hypothetical protein
VQIALLFLPMMSRVTNSGRSRILMVGPVQRDVIGEDHL